MDLLGIEVCIFDVNGVLIDSNAANATAMARSFTEDPAIERRIAEFYLGLTGIDRGEKIRLIQRHIIGKPFEEKEFDLRWDNFGRLGRRSMFEAPSTPGSREVLAELGARGMRRIALSNTPRTELTDVLKARGFDTLLDLIRGGGDWPKSESLVRLLIEEQLDPARCCFIGDGKGDLAAARHAKVPFAAIDPGLGEFDGESGFSGPYRNLADWSRRTFSFAPPETGSG